MSSSQRKSASLPLLYTNMGDVCFRNWGIGKDLSFMIETCKQGKGIKTGCRRRTRGNSPSEWSRTRKERKKKKFAQSVCALKRVDASPTRLVWLSLVGSMKTRTTHRQERAAAAALTHCWLKMPIPIFRVCALQFTNGLGGGSLFIYTAIDENPQCIGHISSGFFCYIQVMIHQKMLHNLIKIIAFPNPYFVCNPWCEFSLDNKHRLTVMPTKLVVLGRWEIVQWYM